MTSIINPRDGLAESHRCVVHSVTWSVCNTIIIVFIVAFLVCILISQLFAGAENVFHSISPPVSIRGTKTVTCVASLYTKFKSYLQPYRHMIPFCRQSQEAYNCPPFNTRILKVIITLLLQFWCPVTLELLSTWELLPSGKL